MRRDRLVERLEACGKGLACGAHHTRQVSDAELAELIESMGYVRGNLDPLGASPAEGGGIEFYFAAWGEGDDEHTSFVAQPWMLADQGYVKRPVCGECKGGTYCATHNQAGVDDWMYEGDVRVPNCRLSTENSACRVCPSCGGSGFGRLVKLDGIDVEPIEEWVGSHAGLARLAYDKPERAFFNQVVKLLAALEEGDTP